MSEETKKMMQISVIREETELSKMLEDIVPKEQKRFTDIELEMNKKESFSIVVYKKQNPFVKFFKALKFGLEKMKIIQTAKEFEYVKNQNK